MALTSLPDPTAFQLSKLRRMIAEPTTATYSDADLIAYVKLYPISDANGHEPYTDQYMQGSTLTTLISPLWIPTYDLNAAAAELWDEKAAALSQLYNFSADGGSYQITEKYEKARGQAAYYRARRSPSNIHVRSYPPLADEAAKLDSDLFN